MAKRWYLDGILMIFLYQLVQLATRLFRLLRFFLQYLCSSIISCRFTFIACVEAAWGQMLVQGLPLSSLVVNVTCHVGGGNSKRYNQSCPTFSQHYWSARHMWFFSSPFFRTPTKISQLGQSHRRMATCATAGFIFGCWKAVRNPGFGMLSIGLNRTGSGFCWFFLMGTGREYWMTAAAAMSTDCQPTYGDFLTSWWYPELIHVCLGFSLCKPPSTQWLGYRRGGPPWLHDSMSMETPDFPGTERKASSWNARSWSSGARPMNWSHTVYYLLFTLCTVHVCLLFNRLAVW